MRASHEQEFLRRRDAVRAALSAAGTQRALFTSAESIYYLTGATYEPIERPFFLAADARQDGYELLVPLLEQRHLHKAWGVRPEAIHTYRDYPAPPGQGWMDALPRLLQGAFVFEPAAPFEIASTLQSAGGHAVDLLRDIRLVKSPWEIERIRRAATYADWGVRQILRASYRGATVAEGFAAAGKLQRKIIREVPDFDAMATKTIGAAWPAPISAEPHSIPTVGMRLEGGPHVALVLTRVNGYAAECERTFFTAAPTPQERERFELMRSARARAMAMLRPGVACAEIDAEVNAYLGAQGWGPAARLHRIGHGFGLGNHEPPWLAEGSTDVLAENMVVSIEPGLYEHGVGGYRHSDTILVTKDGPVALTRFPDTLDALVLGGPSLRQRVVGKLVKRALGLN